MTVGVLALQGCIDPHIKKIELLGKKALKITTPSQLDLISHLILPGGESTVMLRFLEKESFFIPLQEFLKSRPTWGVCAGAILLAQDVINPSQKSLGAISIRAVRNSYGSQRESFKANLSVSFLTDSIEVDFIRAPRFEVLSQDAEVLSVYDLSPVMLKQKNILVSAFHTELGDDVRVHEWFLGKGFR